MKIESEITIKITCSYEELTEILARKGFVVAREVRLLDIYYVKSDVDVMATSNTDIMSNYLIVRTPNDDNSQITYKYKEFNEDGSIKKQGKVNCDVVDREEAYKLVDALGYVKLFAIDNIIKFYRNGDIMLVAAEVNGEYICLEYSAEGKPIEEVIAEFDANYGDIPYDKSDYFVNKGFIELDKIKKGLGQNLS